LAFAAVFLGIGLSVVGPGLRKEPSHLPLRVPPALDCEEQIRRHARMLGRRRDRCLQTLADVERCAALEREAGRPTERLDAAAAALMAATRAIEAGIAREQASGAALRVTRWMDRLPSLVEGLERLDLGACRHRLERLEAASRDGETLGADLQEHPVAAEPTARQAAALLEAGREEIARLRVDLLARQAALLSRPEPVGGEVRRPWAEVETALARGWDWLCRNEARRELSRWSAEAPVPPLSLAEPVRIALPRGRDMSMLPFSLVLLGFTTAHASLAVGDVAMSAPFLLLPMTAFYALFFVPGVLLFREAVRARRHEELTLCGSAVQLRWQWLLWSGAETIVVAPDEPVRRESVGHGEEHPIGRLSLQGIDGRRIYFGHGLTEAQHARILRQIGRPAEPALPASAEPPAAPLRKPDAARDGDDWRLPLF